MKKFVWLILVAGILSMNQAIAKEEDKNQSDEAKKIELRKKIAEKKEELNGTKWEVNLHSNDPKAKYKKDTLTFQNNQVRSSNNADRGFSPTNYTVSMPSQDPEVALWETMQTGPDGFVIFMRGEWKKDMMNGSITEQLEGGKNQEYNFTTSNRAVIAKSSASTEEEVQDSQEDPYEALVSREKKGKQTTSSKAETDAGKAKKSALVS